MPVLDYSLLLINVVKSVPVLGCYLLVVGSKCDHVSQLSQIITICL